MVFTVNNHPSLLTITLKYFEKGHTFMSADSFHHQVEAAMREKKNVYDFQEFVDCINKSGIAVEMKPSDFIDYKKYLSAAKDTEYPLLSNVVEVQFRKGFTKMFWKTSFDESDYKSGEFLQKKFRARVEDGQADKSNNAARGVQTAKKQSILQNIGPLIPAGRAEFWMNLPESEVSADLTINYDHLPPTENED